MTYRAVSDQQYDANFQRKELNKPTSVSVEAGAAAGGSPSSSSPPFSFRIEEITANAIDNRASKAKSAVTSSRNSRREGAKDESIGDGKEIDLQVAAKEAAAQAIRSSSALSALSAAIVSAPITASASGIGNSTGAYQYCNAVCFYI